MATGEQVRVAPGARQPRRGSGGMFASTVVLGRLAGIEIGINWTWVPVFGLFVWTLAGVEFPSATPGRSWLTYAAMGVISAATFFVSLILHELGHALRARREGVQIDGITLWLFGGVAKIAGEFPSAGAEFRIAVAGPLVTLALGTAFLIASALSPLAGAVQAVLAWLGYINMTLLVFNLVPAMPLDGGRMLRAALWARGHDLSAATHRATRIGSALATLLIFLGVLETLAGVLSGLWLAVIGWFILEAGRAEERQIQTRHALEGVTVAPLMTRDPVSLDADRSLEEAAAALRGTARHTAYPVVDGDRFVGLFPLRALADTPPSEWAALTVGQSAIPADRVPRFTPETPAGEALDQLVGNNIGRGVVVEDGRLVGVISITDLARALAMGRPL